MAELASAIPHEIAWQKAMWDGDYAEAYEAAREVLGKLGASNLCGYRATWHYLAGSSGALAAAEGDSNFEAASRSQFRKAKEASSGITWLVGSRGATAPLPRLRKVRRPR
jgi:hypothetical protein